jgi:hypothetical protein
MPQRRCLLIFLTNFLGILFFQKGLLQIKTIIVAHPKPAKLMHGEGDPPPIMPHLDAIPKLVFYILTSDRKRKKKTHCFEKETRTMRPPVR